MHAARLVARVRVRGYGTLSRLSVGGTDVWLCPVHRGRVDGPGGSIDAAAALAAIKPAQVVVELDTRRLADVKAAVARGVRPPAPPRYDILATVHGGLLADEMLPAVRAAAELGAAVYPLDRPASITRNRVEIEVMHPVVLAGLFKYGARSIVAARKEMANEQSKAEDLGQLLEALAPPVHRVLVEERARFLAQQVGTRLDGGPVVVVCGELIAPRLQDALTADRPELIALGPLVHRTVSLLPFLILSYVVVPAAALGYAIVTAADMGVRFSSTVWSSS